MLLVSKEDSFKVDLYYRKTPSGDIKILEKSEQEGDQHEWFEFRRPNWNDVQIIMRQATNGGSLAIDQLDAMMFMDAKIRTLIKAWSLKDADGKVLPLAKLGDLPAPVMVSLSASIDQHLGPAGLLGSQE